MSGLSCEIKFDSDGSSGEAGQEHIRDIVEYATPTESPSPSQSPSPSPPRREATKVPAFKRPRTSAPSSTATTLDDDDDDGNDDSSGAPRRGKKTPKRDSAPKRGERSNVSDDSNPHSDFDSDSDSVSELPAPVSIPILVPKPPRRNKPQPPSAFSWTSPLGEYVAAANQDGGFEAVAGALVRLSIITKQSRNGTFAVGLDSKINIYSLASGKGSEIEALLKMGVPPSRMRVFVSELFNERIVMSLRMNLVARGVEHYWLGPLGCPEMQRKIEKYQAKFGIAHMVFASPPCQDFSRANPQRQGLSGENGKVFEKAVRVIEKLQHQNPTLVFAIENVPTNFQEELDDLLAVNSFESDASEAWACCRRKRLLWMNVPPGNLIRHPDGELAKVLKGRAENAYVQPNPNCDEGADYFEVFKASATSTLPKILEPVKRKVGDKVVEELKSSPVTLEEIEAVHASSSTEYGYHYCIQSSGELVVERGADGNPLPPVRFNDGERLKIIGNSLNVEWLSQLLRPIRPMFTREETNNDDVELFEKLQTAAQLMLVGKEPEE